MAEVSRHHVHLMWEAPEHDGGSPVTHYQIEKREVSRKTWAKVHVKTCSPDSSLSFVGIKDTVETQNVIKPTPDNNPFLPQVATGILDLEHTVTDVVEGKEYLFSVTACNKCGAGEPAYIDEPVNVSSPASTPLSSHTSEGFPDTTLTQMLSFQLYPTPRRT